MQVNPIKVDDHLLWADGSITVEPSDLQKYILKLGSSKNLSVTHLTSEISEFNLISDNLIQVKTSCEISSCPEWTLPDKYKYLNIDEYLLTLSSRIEVDDLYDKRLERLAEEISLFKQLNLDSMLCTLIYIIDTLKEKNIVWGVGRGSSCSSYLLYLLGLHEVDAVKYDIDITDFIKLEGNKHA